MTDYTKTTDFTSKDSLPSGDSGKIIRGAEFGTEFDNIETAVNSKSNIDNPSFTGNITVTGTVDGRDIAADGTKLDTIETSADVTDTANVTAAGAVMDSELTDITAVKALNQGVATTDSPTFAAVTSTGNVTVGGTVDGRDVAADGTKLDTVETNADVTDATNVTAAGALMDSEVTNLAQVKAFDSADYATAAQGTTADNALPKTGGAMTGAITTNSTFDGRDVATDGTKLDTVETNADVTDTANVTAAGAVMDSELTSEASVKALNQGVATTDSPTFAGATVNGTVDIDGAVQIDSTLTVGVNDTGYDVKLFGATSGKNLLWDASEDTLTVTGTTNLVGTLNIDAVDIDGAMQLDSTFKVGVNDTGYDVKFFGDTSGKNLFWDASADSLILTGTADFIGTTNLDVVDIDGAVDFASTTAHAGNATFADDAKAIFGAGSDLQIYHDGSNSVIHDNGTGDLILKANSFKLWNNTSSEALIVADVDGAVKLYHDGSQKLATTSTGIDVTGTVTADALTVDGEGTFTKNQAADTSVEVSNLGTAGATTTASFIVSEVAGTPKGWFRRYRDGTATTAVGFSDKLVFEGAIGSTPTNRMEIASNGDISFYEDTGTTAKLFWDASAERLGVGEINPSDTLELGGGNIVNPNSTGSEITSATFGIGQNIHLEERQVNGAYSDRTDLAIVTNNGFGLGESEKIRIEAGGNVGIGTVSPKERCDINGGGLIVRGALTNGVGSGNGLRFEHTSDIGQIYSLEPNVAWRELRLNASQQTFYIAGGEKMRIDSSGNVGIGTSSPTEDLTIAGTKSGNSVTDAIVDFGILNSNGDSKKSQIKAIGTADTSSELIFSTTASHSFAERMRIDSSGNLLVGKSSSAINTDGVELLNSGRMFLTTTSLAHVIRRKSTDGALVEFSKDSTTVGSIAYQSHGLQVNGETDHSGISFDAFAWVPLRSATRADNTIDLGTTSYRFDDIYATNGTIQTSDRNEKQDIEELSEAEQRVAVAAKGLLRKFRWKSSVADKGDEARIHFGIIAQDLQDAFTAEGLDAGRYAMFINSTWTDEETGEERSRMGVRYSELLAFIIAAI